MVRRVGIVGTFLMVSFITTWPTHPYVGHSHWQRVEWIPFSAGLDPIDFVANVALFAPFGFAVGWPGDSKRIRVALVGAATISIVAETFQVYCHAFPATTDVLANTLGAGIGTLLIRRRLTL